MAINAVGLESAVGFLHETSSAQTAESLLYDLMEPFRFLSDICAIKAFESKTLQLHDFYFTGDDYSYRFEPDAKQRFIDLIREKFNSGVKYKGCVLKWDTVIQEKTSELARYVNDRSTRIDFSEPSPVLERTDNRALRERILGLRQSEAIKRGISKSTLHYLRRNAAGRDSFNVLTRTVRRLEV